MNASSVGHWITHGSASKKWNDTFALVIPSSMRLHAVVIVVVIIIIQLASLL